MPNVRPESIIDASRLVEHSCQCGSIIAIHAPAADLPVATWICRTCGAAYFGGVNSTKSHGVELLAAHGGNSLAGDDQAIPNDGSTSSKATATTSSSAVNTLKGIDRRQHTRYSIGVPVVAVPLAANFTIVGPAVRMMTRDISNSGVGLAYTRFTDAPYYVLDFTSAGMELFQVLMKVVRVSNNGPNYEVAGKFINRLHCADWHSECPPAAKQISKEPVQSLRPALRITSRCQPHSSGDGIVVLAGMFRPINYFGSRRRSPLATAHGRCVIDGSSVRQRRSEKAVGLMALAPPTC